MITTIILIALLVLGIYLERKTDYVFLGFTMGLISGILLLFHIGAVSLVTYDYEMFVEKRNAFEQTLKDSRENGNDLERAAIMQNVSEWNVQLASQKYRNTTFLLDTYIDDRIMDLEPIK